MTLDELPGYLEMLAARAGEAAIFAANGMADAFQVEVKRRLTARSHPRGTRTPSPPGEPPAMESGQLADSVATEPATTPVVATASVAPHKDPRDWVQEWGLDDIRPVRAPRMVFIYGDLYRARRVDVPERSYMRSTVDLMVGDGSLTLAAMDPFYVYMWG